MKKLFSVLAMLALVGSLVFAQEAELVPEGTSITDAPDEQTKSNGILGGKATFTNKLQFNTLTIKNNKENGVGAEFSGFWNQMQAGYKSDMLDIYAQARVVLNTTESVPTSFSYKKSETYLRINFKPGYGFELGINQEIKIPGSYLYVLDDNMGLGNIGRNGFDVAWRGTNALEGLVIAANVDFGQNDGTNFFIDPTFYALHNEKKFALTTGFGAYYEKTINNFGFSAGGQFLYGMENKVNDYSVAAFFSLTPVKELNIWFGYSYNTDYFEEDEDIHVLNFSSAYEANNFFCAVDYITDCVDIFYAGLGFGYDFADAGVKTELWTWGTAFYNEFVDGDFHINPVVKIKAGKIGEFKVSVDVAFDEATWDSISIPVRWTFKL